MPEPEPAPKPHFVVREPRSGEFTGPHNLNVQRDPAGVLRVSASATHLLGMASTAKLRAGNPIEIVWRVQLTGLHDTKPRAFGVFACRVQYDLFNEVFRIDFAPPAVGLTVVNIKAVLQRCLAIDKYALTVISALTPGTPHRVVAVAEIDAQQPTFTTVTAPAFASGPITTTAPAAARGELTGVFVP